MNDLLFQRVINWAAAEETIRVIILEGSQARPDHTEDRFSDYDLDLYVADTLRFAQDDAWLTPLGQIWAMSMSSGLNSFILSNICTAMTCGRSNSEMR
ncbi:MAG: hypothetical protein DYG89_21275 [Caldilinea sp. CFX5]|nr:hypothetical protein [Caldilinea sp. CFX5]